MNASITTRQLVTALRRALRLGSNTPEGRPAAPARQAAPHPARFVMGLSQDPLADALAALVQLGLDETLCRRALAETRRRWGGSQCYIPACDRPARDSVIAAALADGLPAREVAARAHVSVSTVKRRRSQWYR